MPNIDTLELEFFYCCNMRYHLYLFECALWRVYNDNADESIMQMIDSARTLSYDYAMRANEVRSQLLVLGWD